MTNIELLRCREYVARAEPEGQVSAWLRRGAPRNLSLFLAEGFEERGLGVLERLHRAQYRVAAVVLGRYVSGLASNERYRLRFEALSKAVSNDNVRVIVNQDDGRWVADGLTAITEGEVLLDVSALSNRGLFGALDSLATTVRPVALAYSEAATYWPTRAVWSSFRSKFKAKEAAEIGAEFDAQPFLYGGEHRIVLLPNHEGYDTPRGRHALVAFLPFKAARLAAVLSWADYSKQVLIAGVPRLSRNHWRLSVLRELNSRYVQGKTAFQLPTFGYRDSLIGLTDILENQGLLEEHDIHLSPMGSKLQNVACWVLSSLLPSITVLLGVPAQYFSDAYSEGIGRSWIFPFLNPSEILSSPCCSSQNRPVDRQ